MAARITKDMGESGAADKCITSLEGYEEVELLEAVFEYNDVFDNANGPDSAHVYSKYQMENGSGAHYYFIINNN